MSVLSFASTGAGRLAGAMIMPQVEASKPGSRLSAIVGTSGSCGLRRAPVVASALSAPDWICGSAAGTVSNMMFTRFAIRSGCAWVEPR